MGLPLELAVEFYTKISFKDKKRIYQIALGSFRESHTILRLPKHHNTELFRLADHLEAEKVRIGCNRVQKLEIFKLNELLVSPNHKRP